MKIASIVMFWQEDGMHAGIFLPDEEDGTVVYFGAGGVRQRSCEPDFELDATYLDYPPAKVRASIARMLRYGGQWGISDATKAALKDASDKLQALTR